MGIIVDILLKKHGFESFDQAKEYCLSRGVNVEETVKSVQPIAFENAVHAYTVGSAIALKSGETSAEETAKLIGIGLQSYCIEQPSMRHDVLHAEPFVGHSATS